VTTALAPTSASQRRGRADDESLSSPQVRACDALSELRPGALSPPAPRPLLALFLGLLTFGAGPAILWAYRFAAAARRDQAVLQRVTQWAQGRVRDPAAGRALSAAVKRVRPRVLLAVLTSLCAVAGLVVVLSITLHAPAVVGPLWQLLGSTYGFQWPRFSTGPLMSIRAEAFAYWTASLFFAYLLHLLHVHLHARDVQHYLNEFNRLVAVEEGFPPVLLEPIGWGFSPFWGSAAAVMVLLSVWWGIPLAIAGATDSRYRRKAACRMRVDLADRVRMLVHLRPAYHHSEPVTATVEPVVYCATPGCDLPLHPEAKFCPRCGARRGRSVDRRA
jgi:hypothetical protein